MATKLFQNADLKIRYPTDLWFIYPSAPGKPTEDTVIEGTVILRLPSAKKVKKLDVELVGRQNMYLLKQFTKYDTIRRTLTLNIYEEYGELQAGEHEFAWSFIIPSNTAPYERCDFGRCYHRVKATAYGVGRFGADLVAESGEIGIVNNSNEPGQAASGFYAETETMHEVLGPLKSNLFSKFFLIAGFLRFTFTLPGVAQRVRIDDVSVMIKQQINLVDLTHPDRTEQTRPKRVILWSLDSDECGKVYEEDQEFNIVAQMRLADDDTIRPTTNEFAETGIRVSHELQVLVRFTPIPKDHIEVPSFGGGLETKEMKITHPCKISSCDCLVSNLQLPSYDELDLASPAAVGQGGSRPQHKAGRARYLSKCLCTVSTEENPEVMEKIYGADPALMGGAAHFGASRRNREGNTNLRAAGFKSEEEYAASLEDALRARGRSPYPSPGASRTDSRADSRSTSRPASRPSSRPQSRAGSPFPHMRFSM